MTKPDRTAPSNTNGKPKVLLAMSGGVDSSVAAYLLLEQGFDVVGAYMRLGSAMLVPPVQAEPCSSEANMSSACSVHADSQPLRERQSCCSAADADDARRIAGEIGIPFYALDYSEDFSKLIDYFVDEYAVARTPNPCVLCNQWFKFGKLTSFADEIGAELIATGHYARMDVIDDRVRLRRARFLNKDQSYVLFGVDPAILRRARFPLGEMTKDKVRARSKQLGLALHNKRESQDICFAPDRDYVQLVRHRRPEAFRPGPILHVDGRVLGEHSGLPYFTIGQRRGLNVAVGSPIYVCRLEPETATVVVGPKESLFSSEATASRFVWLSGSAPVDSFRAEVKIRYLHTPAAAFVEAKPENQVHVHFDEPQPAITPGQALVVHQGDEVLGGGWIDR